MAEKRQALKAPGVPRAEKGGPAPRLAVLPSSSPPRLPVLSVDLLEAGRAGPGGGEKHITLEGSFLPEPLRHRTGSPDPCSRRPQEAGDVPFALGLLLGVY